VKEKTKQNQLILSQEATLERQIAGLQRKIGRLEEHLDAANASVVRNFDAYTQAERGRQALAANLPPAQRAVYTGLIGMGAGILGC
jgi:hypothetical protein